MVSAAEIQHTRLKGELVFQGFCLKLIRRVWQDDYAEAHGRSGQGQHGADITGRDNRNNYRSAALQCKGSETDDPRRLTEGELIEEVERAKSYQPKLDLFIVAYAGPRDATLQRKAQELSAENEGNGLFRVHLWSWDDIVERALAFNEVAQELLVHNQVPTATTLDPKRPGGGPRANFEAALQSAAASLQAAIVADEVANTGDPVLDAKLDVFRDQLRAGNGQVLVDALRDFVRDIPAQAHPHVRFRAYTNLGSALAQSDDLEAAILAYDLAADAEPTSADGHTSRARASLLRGDRVTALAEVELAMTLAPDRFAATILLEVSPETTTPKSLEARVAAFTDEVDVASSLVRLYANSGDHAEAIRVGRGIAKEDWRKDGVLGQALLSEYAYDSALRIGAPMSAAQQTQIEEARVRLERAWKTAKARGDWKNWTFYAANLASAYRLLGRDEESDRLVLEVFSVDPAAPSIAQRAALAYTRRGELDKAQSAIDAAAAVSHDLEDILLSATIAATRKDWPMVTRLAADVLDQATLDDDRSRAAELLVQAAFRSDKPQDALAMAASLRSRFAPAIGFEARVAEIARRLGDNAELAAARVRLDGFGPLDALAPLARFELADAYADDGNWSKSADLLDGLHAFDRPSEIVRRRLFALYRADRRADGRALYESLGMGALKSSEVLRLGAAIYERSGMLKEALAALARAVIRDPGDLRSRLDWVRLNVRSGTEQPVRKWAKNAQAPPAGDPEDLMELAQILDRYGQRRRAMALGYETLQAHWGSSERLHLMYMSLFLMHSRAEAFLRPRTVGEDSVVFLQSEHRGLADYKIERDGKAGPNVLLPTQPFAMQLLGRKQGDLVVPSTGIGQAIEWTVEDIKHKYLDLLHRAMDAHATLFPNSRSLGQFHFDPTRDDRFEPMFEQARERARVVDEAVRIYSSQPLPIDGIARMLGGDAIDASRGLRFRLNVVTDSCIGLHQERDLAVRAIMQNHGSMMVDVLTLALWDEIGFLDDLLRLKVRPSIVQATIDTLSQRVDDVKQNVNSKGGSLEARGDRVVFIEVSREERQAVVDASQKLLDWVRANTDLVPTEPHAHEILDGAQELLSHSSYDTIATGIANGSLMLIEDRRLRGFAEASGAARCSWTQPMLLTMRHAGQISNERYVELLARLVEHKIGFVSIGGEELFSAALAEPEGATFRALCGAVARPTVDAASLERVATDFCIAAWTRNAPNADRLSGNILERLLTRADGIKLFCAVAVTVARNIGTLPFPDRLIGRLWADYIERFVVGHFIAEAVMQRAERESVPAAGRSGPTE